MRPPAVAAGRIAVAVQSVIAVITESDLYQYVARSRVHNRRKKHAAVLDGLLRDLAEISIGDPVIQILTEPKLQDGTTNVHRQFKR